MIHIDWPSFCLGVLVMMGFTIYLIRWPTSKALFKCGWRTAKMRDFKSDQEAWEDFNKRAP